MSCMIPGKPRESRCLASAPSRRIHRPRVSLNPILADQQSSRSKADVLPLFFISAATQVGFCWVADGKAKACPVGPRRDHVQARARSQRKVALPLIGMLIFERSRSRQDRDAEASGHLPSEHGQERLVRKKTSETAQYVSACLRRIFFLRSGY